MDGSGLVTGAILVEVIHVDLLVALAPPAVRFPVVDGKRVADVDAAAADRQVTKVAGPDAGPGLDPGLLHKVGVEVH